MRRPSLLRLALFLGGTLFATASPRASGPSSLATTPTPSPASKPSPAKRSSPAPPTSSSPPKTRRGPCGRWTPLATLTPPGPSPTPACSRSLSDALQPFLPRDHSGTVLNILRQRCEVLRRLGLQDAFTTIEPQILRECVYDAPPLWRGPRVDHPPTLARSPLRPRRRQPRSARPLTRIHSQGPDPLPRDRGPLARHQRPRLRHELERRPLPGPQRQFAVPWPPDARVLPRVLWRAATLLAALQ